MNPWIVGLIIFCAIAAVPVYLLTFDTNDWIVAVEPNHPPSVNITREGDGIRIRWYGGWDSTFIDHIKVTCNKCPRPEMKYVKPRPGYYIYYPLVPPNATITVFGWAKDSQSYNRITNATV